MYTHHAIPPTVATRRSIPAVTPTGTATASTAATPCATTTGGEEVPDMLMNWPVEVGVSECSDRVVEVRKLSTEDDEGGSSKKPASL